MTRHQPLWQQEGTYQAALDRQLMAGLWPVGTAEGALVTAVPGTLSVSVAPGKAAVSLQDAHGSALCVWDAPEVVDLSPAPVLGRYDYIVVQVRDAAIDGGANNDFIITSVPGPDVDPPTEPAIPPNSLVLARVHLVAGLPTLDGAEILPPRDRLTLTLAVPGISLDMVMVGVKPPAGTPTRTLYYSFVGQTTANGDLLIPIMWNFQYGYVPLVNAVDTVGGQIWTAIPQMGLSSLTQLGVACWQILPSRLVTPSQPKGEVTPAGPIPSTLVRLNFSLTGA
jgi:hypothetical protein